MSRLTVAEASADEIAEEWCSLFHACAPAYPFLHPAWHAVWWDRFGDGHRPLVLVIREGERPAAVAPLMRDGDRLLFAGDPEICDYMDFVVPPDASDDVYDHLLDTLAGESWREIVLWGLPEDSRTLALLPGLAARRGWETQEEFEAVCPRVTLPESWDAYLAALSKKDRHELRRKMRRFAEAGAGMTVETLRTAGEVRDALDDFIRLHTISRQDKREFMTPRMEDFFRAMAVDLAGCNLVRLYFVHLDGRRVAGLLAFDTGDELLLYNSGYDPAYAHASIGLVSKALALKEAIADGKRVYDFLRGAEPYKYDLGAKDREVHTLTIKRDRNA
jgi:CelD/BcsL family acetyltransferase involved in cellulose biosynthesis